MGKNLKTKSRRVHKGFTLMEVLVASSIFAVVMVFVTGVVVASSNYQSKIRIMNQTSEESRRLADMITRDIRSANTKLTIYATKEGTTGTSPQNYTFKNGLAIMKVNNIDYYESGRIVNDSLAANTLIVSLQDNYKIYRTDGTNLYYKEITRAGNDTLGVAILAIADGDKISKDNLKVDIKFGGYAPDDESLDLGQPIIKFLISVGSIKQGTYDQYNTVIRSAVTSRSYNE